MRGIDGWEKDLSKAVKLFEQVARLGLKEAHFELAQLFHKHSHYECIGGDMSRALEHYEIAAKQQS